VAVMYASKVVEHASVYELFDSPQHPYTQGLFRALPKMGGHNQRLETIPGTVPSPRRFPSGCKFHPRCDRMQGEPLCVNQEPALREVSPGHWASCHKIPEFASKPTTKPSLELFRDPAADSAEAPR